MSKKLLLQRMGKSAFFLTGFLVALLIVLVACIGPRIMAFDPMKNSLLERLQKPDWFSKGLSGHILGTDELGRDVLTRLLSGARISLLIAAIVTASQIMLGTALGVLAGFLGGRSRHRDYANLRHLSGTPQYASCHRVDGGVGSKHSEFNSDIVNHRLGTILPRNEE